MEKSDDDAPEGVDAASETLSTSRPRRTNNPLGFYRKHANQIDSILDRESLAAAREERRKIDKNVPENALEFLRTSTYYSASTFIHCGHLFRLCFYNLNRVKCRGRALDSI